MLQARLQRANILLKQGHIDKAEDEYRTVVSISWFVVGAREAKRCYHIHFSGLGDGIATNLLHQVTHKKTNSRIYSSEYMLNNVIANEYAY